MPEVLMAPLLLSLDYKLPDIGWQWPTGQGSYTVPFGQQQGPSTGHSISAVVAAAARCHWGGGGQGEEAVKEGGDREWLKWWECSQMSPIHSHPDSQWASSTTLGNPWKKNKTTHDTHLPLGMLRCILLLGTWWLRTSNVMQWLW